MRIALSCRSTCATETLSQIIHKEGKNRRKRGREKGRKVGKRTLINFSKNGSVVLFSFVYVNWWIKYTLLYCRFCIFRDLPIHVLQSFFVFPFVLLTFYYFFQKTTIELEGWLKVYIGCSSRSPGFSSQHLHDSLQRSSSRGPEALLRPPQAQSTGGVQTHTGQNTIHIKLNKSFKNPLYFKL